MIVKMTILKLLGSSDDKEKIGVAMPEGPPLRCKRQELKRPWRNPSQKDQDAVNLLSPVKPMMSKLHSSMHELGTGLTDVECFTLTDVMDLEAEETTEVLQAPVKPTIKAKWASVQLSRDSIFGGFLRLHAPVEPTLVLRASVDWRLHAPVEPTLVYFFIMAHVTGFGRSLGSYLKLFFVFSN